ncbi:MAG: transposase [Solirubrobacteraceae bacterium]
MPQNFIVCDRAQSLLLPPDLMDWVPDDHVVWSILGAVEQMDLAAFYGAYRSNGKGRAAYEPSMVVSLLLYSYARGNRSSRGIERACREDVVYKLITALRVPITRRSRISAAGTRPRWASCSPGCWRCAGRLGWLRLG